jgi:hypothetical protein
MAGAATQGAYAVTILQDPEQDAGHRARLRRQDRVYLVFDGVDAALVTVAAVGAPFTIAETPSHADLLWLAGMTLLAVLAAVGATADAMVRLERRRWRSRIQAARDQIDAKLAAGDLRRVAGGGLIRGGRADTEEAGR